jgi:hypothetical protein
VKTITKNLVTAEERQSYIEARVVPYIRHMTSEEVKQVAFEPKPRAQEVFQSVAMIIVKQSGRLPELAKYRRLIRDAISPKFSDWEKELASELQCVATSIVLADLVGEVFVGDEESYDFNGVEIEVTNSMVEMVCHTWNEKTSLAVVAELV